MAREPIPFAPKVFRGAFVQLVEQMVGYLPNIVLFRINPATITKNDSVWNPFDGQGPNRGTSAPDLLPYPAEETIAFDLFLSATEDLRAPKPLVVAHGVQPQIAALRKLTQASEGLIGDLVGSATALLAKETREIKADRIPLTILMLGPGLVVPVRLTSFSVEETKHDALLNPHEVKVSVEMRVLTPDLFKCRKDSLAKLAIATYNVNKLLNDGLAVANIASNVEEVVVSGLPI